MDMKIISMQKIIMYCNNCKNSNQLMNTMIESFDLWLKTLIKI